MSNITGGSPYSNYPVEQPKSVVPVPFLRDTVASAMSLPDSSRFLVPPPSSVPKIPAPDLKDNTGYDPGIHESDQMRLVVACSLVQISHADAWSVINVREIKTQVELQRHFQTLIWNIRNEASEIAKKNKVLSKVDLGVTVVMTISFVAGLVLAVATGGAAIGKLLGAVQGVTALTQGGSIVAKTVLGEQKNQLESDLIGVKTQARNTTDTTEEMLKDNKAGFARRTTTIKGLREVLDASRAI